MKSTLQHFAFITILLLVFSITEQCIYLQSGNSFIIKELPLLPNQIRILKNFSFNSPPISLRQIIDLFKQLHVHLF